MTTFTLTQTPEPRFAYLYPKANGCYIEAFPFGDTDNYKCVDDEYNSLTPDTDYVFMDGATMVTDVYDMDDHDILSGTINYVKGCCRARSHGYAPAHDFVYRIVLSSDDDCDTWALSRIMPLNTGFTTFENAWNLNPFTSAAWAWADIDALHAGFEASSPSVTCDTFTFLPVADGDRTDITGVTSGYEHWEAVSAERPLTEVSEVSDVYHYDLYEYLMASDDYSIDTCYSINKIGNYVITTGASDTFIYAWKNGLVQYLDEINSGGYCLVGSGNNIYYIGTVTTILVLTYSEVTKTLSLTQTYTTNDVTQDMIIKDGYLFSATKDEGLLAFSIAEDGQITLVDQIDTFQCIGVSYDDNYIYGSGDGKLKAFTFASDTLTQVGTVDVASVDYGIAADNNGNVFISVGLDGLKAFSFDGATFTLEDTIDDGGHYVRLTYNGAIHVGDATAALLRAYSYDGSLTLIDSYTDVPNPCRGVTHDDSFIFVGGKILTFNGTEYKPVHDVADGMLDKYLTDDILTVSVVAKMGKEYDATDGAEIYGRMIIKTHDTEYTSSEFKLEYPQKWYSYTWSVNPNTTNAWTLEEIKAVQAGIGLKGDGKYAACSICQLVLSSESNVSPEIQTSQVYLKVNYTPDVSTCTLNKPEEVSLDMGRNIQILNFWSGNREVYDESRANKTLVLTGTEYERDPNFYTGESVDTVITGYFDAYDAGEAWGWNPANLVDGNPATYAYMMMEHDSQFLTSHNLAAVPAGNIAKKVELRVNGYHGTTGTHTIGFTPVIDGTEGGLYKTDAFINFTKVYSNWVDITDEPLVSSWTPDEIANLQVKIEAYDGTGAFAYWAYASIVEIRVTYSIPEVIASTPCERIQCVRSMGEEGAIVTPSGLGWDTGLIDESYRIRSFGWKLIQENPVAYAWVLELEASE